MSQVPHTHAPQLGNKATPQLCCEGGAMALIWILARQLALTDLLSSTSSAKARKMRGSDLAEGFPLAVLYALKQARRG